MGPLDRTGPANPYEPPRTQNDLAPTAIYPTEGIDLSKENPFFTIWTRPRATIRGIVNTDPTYRVIPLTLASGIVQALGNETQRNAGDLLPLSAILGIAFVLGPIGGLIGLYVSGWLAGVSCRWLGGRADSREVRAALAWSSVPTLATIPIWLVQLAVFGHEMFTSTKPSLVANPALALLLIATAVPIIVLALWSLVILLKTLGEVQGFSAWRALGSMFLLILLILLILVPIMFLAAIGVLYLSR